MLQEEFEKRTGLEFTAEEYAEVEKVYMNTNLDKDAFCADFKRHRNSKIIDEQNAKIEALRWNAKQEREAMQAQLAEMAERLEKLEESYMLHASENKRCNIIGLVGERRYAELIVKLGLPIDEEDRDIILKLIKK